MDDAGERARELRREGKTIREIQEILGTRSSRVLSEWLGGVPPDPSVRARKAKTEARERARALRADGWSYNAIAAELGVAKSSVSVWCRDIVLTEEQRETLQQAAAAEIGDLTDRELFLVGVALYWAEGTKEKTWGRSTQVAFINSDPTVIGLFVAWLGLIGIRREDLVLRLSIHESADVEAATAFWSDIVRVPAMQWRSPTLKRHNPRTARQNVGDSYHGCLVVRVRRSADLNRRIAGWWRGIALLNER